MYLTLLKQLSLYEKEEFFNDKKAAIQTALSEYFAENYQKVSLEITFRGFTLRNYFLDPSRSESFDRMIHNNMIILLDLLKKKEEFLVLPFLVSIPESIYQRIFKEFTKLGENVETARTITRQQINTVFKLDDRDIVFFLRGKITIRLFTPPKKLSDGIDKRFAGETMEAMEALYLSYFPEGAWEYIEPILDEVITEKLNFEMIDNITYHKQFVPVFRSMIEILLLDVVKEEDRTRIEGLTGYVLRQHFHKILLYTARNLLDCIEKRDKNAESFIKYYTDDVIIDANGNKIQKYAITDEKQQKWNYSSILSVMMQYKQMKVRIATQKESISAAQKRVDECESEIESEENHQSSIIKNLESIRKSILENDSKIVEIKGKSASKESSSISAQGEIKRINNLQDELHQSTKDKKSLLEFSRGRLSNKSIDLSRKQKKVLYETKSLESILEQTKPIIHSYETIVEALSLVLAKR